MCIMLTEESYLQVEIDDTACKLQLPFKKYEELFPLIKDYIEQIFNLIYKEDEIDETRPFVTQYNMNLGPILYRCTEGKYAPYKEDDRIEDNVRHAYHTVQNCVKLIHRAAQMRLPKDLAWGLMEYTVDVTLGTVRESFHVYPYIIGRPGEFSLLPPVWPKVTDTIYGQEYPFSWHALIQEFRHSFLKMCQSHYCGTGYGITGMPEYNVNMFLQSQYFKAWHAANKYRRYDIVNLILAQFAINLDGSLPEMRDQFWVTLQNITAEIIKKPERAIVKQIKGMMKELHVPELNELVEMIANADHQLLDCVDEKAED